MINSYISFIDLINYRANLTHIILMLTALLVFDYLSKINFDFMVYIQVYSINFNLYF